jgi:cytidylate kinase
MSPVVTVSASYGTFGDRIARAVAQQLDLPFLDRAIPAAAAHEFALSGVAESVDEPVPSLWERILISFAGGSILGPTTLMPEELIETPEQFRMAHEKKLLRIAESTGAVMLGRAAMAVLGRRPDVLCVRLDGPVEARISQAVAQGVDEEAARKGQQEVDGAREAYARVFFGARQDDAHLYHIVLDSTALSVEACVDVIVRSARDRFGTS